MIPARSDGEGNRVKGPDGAISDGKFRKKEHLLKTRDFRRVYNKGLPFKKEAIVLYRLQNELTYNRLGFSISKKNVALASSRNRIRRLFREAYRKKKQELKKGCDLVIVVKRDLARRSFDEITALFHKIVKDAGLLA